VTPPSDDETLNSPDVKDALLVTRDGRRLILEKGKGLKKKELSSVTGVARGGWRLL